MQCDHVFSLEKVVHCDHMHSVWRRLCIVIVCIQSGEGCALWSHAFSLEKVHCDHMHLIWRRLCNVITCVQSGESCAF